VSRKRDMSVWQAVLSDFLVRVMQTVLATQPVYSALSELEQPAKCSRAVLQNSCTNDAEETLARDHLFYVLSLYQLMQLYAIGLGWLEGCNCKIRIADQFRKPTRCASKL
jgi:hypothetical protein